MAIDASRLLGDFRGVAEAAGLGARGIVHEQQLAPHQPHKLPAGKGAVYVFSVCDSLGQSMSL